MYWKFTYNKNGKKMGFFAAKYQNYCQRKEGKFMY